MSKPDAAMLWARERAAQRHPSRSLALEILAGKQDNYSVVTDFADAFRAGQAHIDGLVAALERQADNMAFLLNNANVPTPWCEKFTQELADDRAALTAAKGQ